MAIWQTISMARRGGGFGLVCLVATGLLVGCGSDGDGAGGAGASAGTGGSAGAGATAGTGGTGGSGGGDGWVCAAAPTGSEYYVATDGDDASPGTFDAPFGSFGPAVTRAQPGDVIYVRAGTYGQPQAMVRNVERNWDSYPATSCPDGEVLADQYCFHDVYSFIAISDFIGWASNSPAFEVQSGTAELPISVCAYPGEHVTLDATGWTSIAVSVGLEAYWTIADFEIVGGMVNIGGGSQDAAPHDIVIRRNDVHDITTAGGDNPGIVRIDRGDVGGPHDIFVWDNRLHAIYDVAQPGQWQNVTDAQHFGAVTTLSSEIYQGYDTGGTGYVEIIGNELFELPQTFFFKNPMAGPIEIRDNHIHDCGVLGLMTASNVHMAHNLVVGLSAEWWGVGDAGNADPRIQAISGQNALIEYNTFVGIDNLFGLRCGTGHTVQYNVFFGLSGQTAGASWDTPSYIAKNESYPDPLDPAQSLLQQVSSNHNCFIAAHDDFQAVARYLPPEVTGGDWLVEHYDHAQAEATFGFDTESTVIIESDPANVFVDPAGDYHLLDPAACPSMGYFAYPGQT
jgi:hypothetical protein